MTVLYSALRTSMVLARAAAPRLGVTAGYNVADRWIQADLRRFLRMHEAEANIPLSSLLFLDVCSCHLSLMRKMLTGAPGVMS